MRRLALTLILGMVVIATALLPLASQRAEKPSFEVASIKPFQFSPDFNVSPVPFEGPVRISGNGVTTRGSVTGLVMAAYKLRVFQISGAPNWANTQWYDVSAKTKGESTATMDQVRQLLQTLLADRFQLKLHRETKELPVYELVKGKNGLKIRAISIDGSPIDVTQGSKLGTRILKGPLKTLVELLSPMLDRPVIDKTGLTGIYEFTTDWARADLNMNLSRTADQTSSGESLFTAVEEQLGLKLEASKDAVEVLVIDSVQRPSEN